MTLRLLALAVALAVAPGLPVAAGAAAGGGTLVGRSKLAVPRCGALRASFAATVLVRDDGTWTAQSDEGDLFAGTYSSAGRGGRKLLLVFDEPSLARFVAAVEEDVATVCESAPAVVTAARPKALQLVVNAKATKARLLVRYAFSGTAGGRSGTAKYKLVARGPWTAG